jgi:hypothetical protein
MSFGSADREDLYKQVNPLGAYVAKDYSEFSDSTAADGTISKIDSRWRRPPNAHFGYSSRADHEVQANFLGAPMSQDHSQFQDTTDASKVVSKMDSRYQTAPSATFGVSAREDILKRANDLGTYQPIDYSDVGDTVNVELLTKAIDKRYRTPASPPIATARRDDYLTQANPLGVYMPQDLSGFSDTTDFEKVISPIDSRYKRNPAARFSTASRDDLKLQANPLGVYMSQDYSHMPDNTDPNKLISPMNSRWKNQPRVPFSTSKRDDILKEANVLGVAQPSSITSTVKYPDKTISDFDSRFRTQPRVPIATAPRDAIYKQVRGHDCFVSGIPATSGVVCAPSLRRLALAAHGKRYRASRCPSCGARRFLSLRIRRFVAPHTGQPARSVHRQGLLRVQRQHGSRRNDLQNRFAMEAAAERALRALQARGHRAARQ